MLDKTSRMKGNHLILFLRNIRRQRLFSLINLTGISISLLSTLTIYLYVRNEFSYDKFHEHAERIYRVNQTFIWGDNGNQFASTGPGVATAMHAELPEVELITSIHTPGNFIISSTNDKNEVRTFEESKIFAADTNFFRMFNFPLLKGSPEAALRQPQTLVMTASTARKYFGSENALGKLVRLGNPASRESQTTYEVTGVVADLPQNSYIQFDILLSMNSFPRIRQLNWSWVWTQLETYVRLDEHADIQKTRVKLAAIPRKYAEETLQRAMNTSYDEYIKSGKKWELFLQPMTEIHLPSSLVLNRLSDSGDIRIIYSLIGAGILIVLLSCINFMNMSMAQYSRRLRESGIRKILGLGKIELGVGYFLEAFFFCLAALLIAFALCELLLPFFNNLTGKTIALQFWSDPRILIVSLLLVVFMALISSIYPALVIGSYNPVDAIKRKSLSGKEGKLFRNGLVVFQFSVSILLTVCTAVVFQQLKYVAGKNLGFDKENLVVIQHVEGIRDPEQFANAALNVPGVEKATVCSSAPPRIWGGDNFTAEGMSNKTFPLNFTLADEQYISTLGVKMKYGRDFKKENPGDVDRVILNEAAVRRIGWANDESVLGKKLFYDERTYEVAGVLSDFNYWPLATPIDPMGIFHIKSKVRDSDKKFLTVRLADQDGAAVTATLERIHQLWKIHSGDAPYQYEFVDQAFAESFRTQEKTGQVLILLSFLSITIASIGLLGMMVYSMEQRSKEIGIRKVSGATTVSIMRMITRGYAQIIFVAFLIGAPLSWWLMDVWLQEFAFRVKPSPLIFVFTALGTLVISFLITSYHVIKAARTNPVEVLRDE